MSLKYIVTIALVDAGLALSLLVIGQIRATQPRATDPSITWKMADSAAVSHLIDDHPGGKFLSSTTFQACVGGRYIWFFADGSDADSGRGCWR